MRRLTSFIWWSVVALVVIVAGSLVSFKQLLPYANQYRAQIERNLTQIVGYPVELGEIRASLEGLDPTISVEGIQVLTGQSHLPISVDKFVVRVDLVRSILSLSPQFVYIRFVKPEVALSESEGLWAVNGIPLVQGKAGGLDRALGYLLALRQFTLLEGSASVESSRFGTFSLNAPAMYVNGTDERIAFSADVIHSDYSEPVSIQAELIGDLGDKESLLINAKMSLPKIGVDSKRMPILQSFGVKGVVAEGDLWLRYDNGRDITLSGALSLPDISTDALPSIGVRSQFKARYAFSRKSLHAEVVDLTVSDAGGKRYPPSNLSLDASLADDNMELSVLFDQMDLELAELLGLPAMDEQWFATRMLSEMRPRGKALNGSLKVWKDDTVHFKYLSNLKQVSGSGFNGIPSVDKLDAVISLSESEGYVQFASNKGRLGFPTLYEDSWMTESLSGQVDWRRQQDVFLVSGQDLNIQYGPSDIKGQFRLEVRKDLPDWMLLDIRGTNLRASDRLTFIPERALAPSLRDWIQDSIPSGKINKVDFLYHGGTKAGLPSHLIVDLGIREGEIRFAEGWPHAKNVDGELLVDKEGVFVDVTSADLNGLELENISVDVPLAGGVANWINVAGKVEDDVGSILSLLRETPLATSALKPFDDWQADGDVAGEFAVSIPLSQQVSEPVVMLDLNFENNSLMLTDINLPVEIETGHLAYHSRDGISNSDFRVSALGGESSVVVGSRKAQDGLLEIQVDLSGEANLYQVLKWREAPQWLLDNLSGKTNYQGQLFINRGQAGQIGVDISSDFKGVSSNLPPPMRKSGEEVKPFALSMASYDDEIKLMLTYDRDYRSRILLKKGELASGEFHISSGQSLMSEPVRGITLKGQLAHLDVPQWMTLLSGMRQKEQASYPRLSLDAPEWLTEVQFIVDELVVNGANKLNNAKVAYSRQKAPNRFEFGSDEMNIRLDKSEGLYQLHAGYISWNGEGKSDPKEYAASPIRASQIPSMRIRVDQLFLDGKPYGDWSLNLTNEGQRLRVQPLSTQLKNGKFEGSLFWQDDDDHSNVELVLAIKGSNAAELTNKFSPTPFLTSKEYQVDVALSWLGHPFAVNKPSLTGRIAFSASKGSFSQVDELPGFLRALGIFNINALSRRLTLDFSDVYEPGLTYDTLEGVLSLDQGVVQTSKPVLVNSPTAELVLEGKANIVDETLDERLTATFPIANALPLAGLLLGTPQLAGLLYITDKLIGGQISKVTSIQYQIKGPFAEPEITPVKFKPKES